MEIFKDYDDIRDFAITIVNTLIEGGLVPDCTGTENEIEFEIQDCITSALCIKLGIENLSE